MCWTSYKTPVSQIADSDINIFKIVRKTHIAERSKSLFYNFEYNLKEPYSLSEKLEVDARLHFNNSREFIINEGFHSYHPKVYLRISPYIVEVLVSRYEFHIGWIPYSNDLVIAHGIIPKGSQYFLNSNGEYVSNRIILTEYTNLN